MARSLRGSGSFSLQVPALYAGAHVTATTTDVHTSSFSNCVLVTGTAWDSHPDSHEHDGPHTDSHEDPDGPDLDADPRADCPDAGLGISPSSGSASGGSSITASGTGFVPGVSLTIGGVMAESIVVVATTEIDAAAPALSPGTLNDVAVSFGSSRPSPMGPGTMPTLAAGWMADFLDVAQEDPFHASVEAPSVPASPPAAAADSTAGTRPSAETRWPSSF